MSDSALSAFVAATQSISASAEAIAALGRDHLGVSPEAVSWASAEHAQRLARALEALAAEIQAFGGGR